VRRDRQDRLLRARAFPTPDPGAILSAPSPEVGIPLPGLDRVAILGLVLGAVFGLLGTVIEQAPLLVLTFAGWIWTLLRQRQLPHPATP
jgi:hypothetical protein